MTKNKTKNKTTKQRLPDEAKRTCKIGAKVTPEQRNRIYGLAQRCNMTVSSYLLARAYNYRPKERLTQHQLSLLENLSNCRSDLVNFVSALHGMKRENRLQLFGQLPVYGPVAETNWADGKAYRRFNNDHNIHIRAQKAAEAVAIKRGWITPMKIRGQNLEQVAQDCLAVLKEMPEWSWNSYIAKLKQKGYDIKLRVDSKRNVVGYVLAKGNAKYKASELGKGRALTASRIETTWRKLRQQSAAKATTKPVTKLTAKPTLVVSQPPKVAAPFIDYIRWKPNTTSYELPYKGEAKRFYIPDEAMQIFNDEFDYRDTANWQELIQMSVALFVGLSGGVGTASSGGGGGSENDLPWGRDKDEDDREWARRCARRAARTIGIQKRGGMKR